MQSGLQECFTLPRESQYFDQSPATAQLKPRGGFNLVYKYGVGTSLDPPSICASINSSVKSDEYIVKLALKVPGHDYSLQCKDLLPR